MNGQTNRKDKPTGLIALMPRRGTVTIETLLCHRYHISIPNVLTRLAKRSPSKPQA